MALADDILTQQCPILAVPAVLYTKIKTERNFGNMPLLARKTSVR